MEIINSIKTIKDKDDILKQLYGKVFHVTDYNNLESIFKEKALLANKNLRIKSPFGNIENGFFRLRNCISFFDYRDFDSENFKEHVEKCDPFMPLNTTNKIVIFFLDKTEYPKLIYWDEWKTGKFYSQMVVPFIEVGLKEKVTLESISNIIIFEDNTKNLSPINELLKNL